MAILAFDTLKLAKKLSASGFTPEQAKGAANALSETMGEYLVTKEHFDRTIGGLRGDMDTQFERVDAKFERLVTSMETRFQRLETSVDSRFERLESSVDSRFDKVDGKFTTLEASIDKRFAEYELRLLTRIAGMFGATIAILIALDKLL